MIMLSGVLHRLTRDVPGCARRIIEKSPRLLQRTGYRLAGREILSDEDVLSGRQRGSGGRPCVVADGMVGSGQGAGAGISAAGAALRYPASNVEERRRA